MNDKPDVGFVDSHAEGVGRGNHPQVAANERFLHVLLGFRGQAGMEVGGDVESLGHRVTAAVVQAIFAVIFIDAIFALIYMQLNI